MKLATLFAATLFPLAATAAGGQPGAHFIENWDLDADGVVTLAELEEKRGDVFYTFDADENGYMDVEEYTFFDAARKADMEGQGEQGKGRMSRVQKGLMLEFNDANKDGQVSREEFVAKAADWMSLIDRDGSSDVTPADFGPRG